MDAGCDVLQLHHWYVIGCLADVLLASTATMAIVQFDGLVASEERLRMSIESARGRRGVGEGCRGWRERYDKGVRESFVQSETLPRLPIGQVGR